MGRNKQLSASYKTNTAKETGDKLIYTLEKQKVAVVLFYAFFLIQDEQSLSLDNGRKCSYTHWTWIKT